MDLGRMNYGNMSNIIYCNGLKLRTRCKYYQFKYGNTIRVSETSTSNLFLIEFPRGTTGSDLHDSRIEVINNTRLVPTRVIKSVNVVVDLNGLKFIKFTNGILNFNQYIVGDINEFSVDYNEHAIKVLIPESKIDDKDGYIALMRSIPYIEVIGTDVRGISNFYNVSIWEECINLTSTEYFSFNTKEFYDKYVLKTVDVLDEFRSRLKKILNDFGMELLTLPIDQDTATSNYITYEITDMQKRDTHKDDRDVLNEAMHYTSTIDFHVSCTNFILFNDFKIKYQNIDLVSNFTEFTTKDSIGRDWWSSVWWEPINTNFSHDYSTNQDGNYAYTADFSCTVYYWTVKDIKHNYIKKVILDVVAKGVGESDDKKSIDEYINTKSGKANDKITYVGPFTPYTDDKVLLSEKELVELGVLEYNGDCYKVGAKDKRATLWINDVPIKLTDMESIANSIRIEDGDVIIDGTLSDGARVYWRNMNLNYYNNE